MTNPADAPAHSLPLGSLVLVPPEKEAEAVVERMDQWNSSLKPWDNYECGLTQGVCRESIRLERLHQREILLRHAQAVRAANFWEEDRRREADRLATGMTRHPGLVILQLRGTRHGCELLAERWETLRDTLEARGAWTESQHLLALNLLGVPPELRDAITPLDAPAGADPLAHRLAVASAQARRHRDLAAALAPVDAIEREAARVGLGPDSPQLEGLSKEERASDRRFAFYRSQFKTSRRDPRPPDPGDLPAYIPPRSRPEPSYPAADRPATAAGRGPRGHPDPDVPQPQPSHTAHDAETRPDRAAPGRPRPGSRRTG